MAKKNARNVDSDTDDMVGDDAEDTSTEDTAEAASANGATEDVDHEELPEGFEQLGAEQSPFVKKEAGVIVRGELVGRFLRKKNSGKGSPWFYQIRVDHQVRGVLGSKKQDTYREVMVKPGEVISIDESAGLEELRKLAEGLDYGGRYAVYLKYLRKIDLSSGNTFWHIKRGFKVLTPPRSQPARGSNPEDRIR